MFLHFEEQRWVESESVYVERVVVDQKFSDSPVMF